MSEAQRIKDLKKREQQNKHRAERGRKSSCLVSIGMLLTMVLLLASLVVNVMLDREMNKLLEAQFTTQVEYQPIGQQIQTVVVVVPDNRAIVGVGYEYYNNEETVTSWECGPRMAICQWYTPSLVPVGRELFVIVEYSDGLSFRYPFSPALDYLEINGMNRVHREVLP